MPGPPSPAECMAQLRGSGWTAARYSIHFVAYGVVVWVVVGERGEGRLLAAGCSEAEAWWGACEQAAAVGMLGHGG